MKCEGWDSNPGIPTEAGLKPAAFGLAQPPSREYPFTHRTKVGFGVDTDPLASTATLRTMRATNPRHTTIVDKWSTIDARAKIDARATIAFAESKGPT